MAAYNLHPYFPYPAIKDGVVVAGQAITVTSTATKQFAAFAVDTDTVVFDVQTASVWCTFDTSTPATGAAHILSAGLAYQMSKAAATAAKFVATTTTNAVLYASEFRT